MATTALERFVDEIREIWGPLDSELVSGCSRSLKGLLEAAAREQWLSDLHRQAPAYEELHRDAGHGFLLLAHTETSGLYRPPHDHGRGWVIYALQRGEIEMGSYARVEHEDGVRLVRRDSTVLRPGQLQVYLPGDIHDTRCRSESALLLRFTDRDLRVEDREEGRVTRYVGRNGVWTLDANA